MTEMKSMLNLWRETKSPLLVVRHSSAEGMRVLSATADQAWLLEDQQAYRDLAELLQALEIWRETLELEKNKLRQIIAKSDQVLNACISYQQNIRK